MSDNEKGVPEPSAILGPGLQAVLHPAGDDPLVYFFVGVPVVTAPQDITVSARRIDGADMQLILLAVRKTSPTSWEWEYKGLVSGAGSFPSADHADGDEVQYVVAALPRPTGLAAAGSRMEPGDIIVGCAGTLIPTDHDGD